MPRYADSISHLQELFRTPFHQAMQDGDNGEFHRRLAAAELTPEEKLHWAVSRRIGFFLRKQADEEFPKCPRCWVSMKACYCSRVPQIQTPHRFYAYLFFKEFPRSSNTGKLLLMALDGELLVMGVEEHERRLMELCSLPNTCVVYPSNDSCTVGEFHDALCGKVPAETLQDGAGPLFQAPAVPLNFILLDGTWPQARTLVNRLPPTVSFVRITPPEQFYSLFNGLRKQTQLGRISTLEAGVFLLREMGLPDEDVNDFDNLLKFHVDLIRKQSHRPSAYQTFNKEKYDLHCQRISADAESSDDV
eukprot:GGOE01061293.1.p1 GENE.GGOE01061293.1~~GGOE01061293.1.p1  ORF type:complete len:304 (-),score=86.15 GGOE01061293.1:15-926(-)